MRVLVSIVGERSEHWLGLFRALAEQAEHDVSVLGADMTPAAEAGLRALAARHPRFHYIPGRHVLGERLTGHMASTFYARRTWRELPETVDLIHVIGEASYPTTRQMIGVARRRYPGVPVTLYGAQNVLQRFPWPFRAFERHAWRSIAHAFPVSQDALDVMRAKGYQGSATVLPLGVDTGHFRPAPQHEMSRPYTVGFVGRLEAHKGVEQLLDAAARIGCRVLLVGEGSQREALALRARELGIEERVRFAGWQSHAELPGLIGEMDVLALPSVEVVQQRVPFVKVVLREQFGRVLCEAMACGVPVVGARLGEIPRVIGDAGFVFSPGSVGELTDVLQRLTDAELRRGLGRRGRVRAETLYEWSGIAERLAAGWEVVQPVPVNKSAQGLKFARFGPNDGAWSSPTM